MNPITFVQQGDDVDYTPAAAKAAALLVTLASMLGVTKCPIAANEQGAISLGGVYKLKKATGANTGFTAGMPVFYNAAGDTAAGLATNTYAAGLPLLGVAVEVAGTVGGDDDAFVYFRLQPATYNTSDGLTEVTGLAAVTGTLEIQTGLSAVTRVQITPAEDQSINFLGVSATVPAQAGADIGKFTAKCWKPTSNANPTPVAATAEFDVYWTAYGRR